MAKQCTAQSRKSDAAQTANPTANQTPITLIPQKLDYVEQAGEYDLTIRSASTSTGRRLKISQCNTTLVDNFTVPQVTAWGEFKTWSAGKVRLTAGYQKIRVSVEAGFLDLDWIHLGPFNGTLDPPAPVEGAAVPSAGCGKARPLQNGRINLQSGGVSRSATGL